MSPVRVLLVNVLDLTTSASLAPRNHSLTRWPRSPSPRFLSLGSAYCPTGAGSLPWVKGLRRRGIPPPGVFVPLLSNRHNSFRALWFSCPRRAPWAPSPATSRGWEPAPDTARLTLCSRLQHWPEPPGGDRRARRPFRMLGLAPADSLFPRCANPVSTTLNPKELVYENCL